jgi:hypothetical protein
MLNGRAKVFPFHISSGLFNISRIHTVSACLEIFLEVGVGTGGIGINCIINVS